MTSSPRTLPYPGGGGVWFYLFPTSSSISMYGTEAFKEVGNKRMLWAGDAESDGELKYVGIQNNRDAVFQAIGGQVPTATVSGYLNTDTNLDGIVKYIGLNNDRDVILENIGGWNANDTRVEQLP